MDLTMKFHPRTGYPNQILILDQSLFLRVLPSESASQRLNTSRVQLFNHRSSFSKLPRPAPVTSWMKANFEATEVAGEWVIKRADQKTRIYGQRYPMCVYIDNKTGIQCPWKTSDSSRQNSTTNMQRHLTLGYCHFTLKVTLLPGSNRHQHFLKGISVDGLLMINKHLQA
ncbi:hypothetical protein V1527DRAFT_466452 [Lipomyces starkeyi]